MSGNVVQKSSRSKSRRGSRKINVRARHAGKTRLTVARGELHSTPRALNLRRLRLLVAVSRERGWKFGRAQILILFLVTSTVDIQTEEWNWLASQELRSSNNDPTMIPGSRTEPQTICRSPSYTGLLAGINSLNFNRGTRAGGRKITIFGGVHTLITDQTITISGHSRMKNSSAF